MLCCSKGRRDNWRGVTADLGAINAGLLAASILALGDAALSARLQRWRAAQTEAVAEEPA